MFSEVWWIIVDFGGFWWLLMDCGRFLAFFDGFLVDFGGFCWILVDFHGFDRFWRYLEPSWGRLEPSWARLGPKKWPTWLQLDSQNGTKMVKKSIQKSIKMLMPLEISF